MSTDRNLARFTEADAEAVAGRSLTEGEYQALVKTLENSSMGEVFAECVALVVAEGQNYHHTDCDVYQAYLAGETFGEYGCSAGCAADIADGADMSEYHLVPEDVS